MHVRFVSFVFFIAQIAFGISSQDCDSDGDCLKCGSVGCLKCSEFLTYPSRKCVSKCPHGYRSQWSNYADYMGRICVHRGSFMGLSNDALTVLTGVLSGTALCVVIIACGLIYMQYRRKHLLNASELGSDLDDTPERKEFLKQLEILRPYAQTFLEILNDSRRQLRESHRDGDHSAIAVYRPIIRDLAKILLLLNRPVEQICVPEDWEHLFAWGEKTLKRCKRMSEVSQPQVAQLINFLQTPIEPEPRTGTTMSTFKPDQPFGSTASLQHATIKTLGEPYDNGLNPQWKFDYNMINSNSQFNPILWKSSKESLQNGSYFLDDDCCQLGFRPQDEITTEL